MRPCGDVPPGLFCVLCPYRKNPWLCRGFLFYLKEVVAIPKYTEEQISAVYGDDIYTIINLTAIILCLIGVAVAIVLSYKFNII